MDDYSSDDGGGSSAGSPDAVRPAGGGRGGNTPPARKVACLPCAAGKRRCDAARPACNRCSDAGDAGSCVYPVPRPDAARAGRGKKKGSSCLACRTGKRSCDGGRPACSRCAERGTQCVYTAVKPRAPRGSGHLPSASPPPGRQHSLHDRSASPVPPPHSLYQPTMGMAQLGPQMGFVAPMAQPGLAGYPSFAAPPGFGGYPGPVAPPGYFPGAYPIANGYAAGDGYGTVEAYGLADGYRVPDGSGFIPGGVGPAPGMPFYSGTIPGVVQNPAMAPGGVAPFLNMSQYGASPGVFGDYGANGSVADYPANGSVKSEPAGSLGNSPSPPSIPPGWPARAPQDQSPPALDTAPPEVLPSIARAESAAVALASIAGGTFRPFAGSVPPAGPAPAAGPPSATGPSPRAAPSPAAALASPSGTSDSPPDLASPTGRPSPVLALPPDYPSKLYPGIPAGLLPPPEKLPAVLDAFFGTVMHDIIHRATFEARLARGECRERLAYRQRFRARLAALAVARSGAAPAGEEGTEPLVPVLVPNDTMPESMDTFLLATIVWAGARMSTTTLLEPEAIAGLEAFLAAELREFSAWQGQPEPGDSEAMEALRTELGIAVPSTPSTPIPTPASSSSSSGGQPPQPRFPPFSSPTLTPAERASHDLHMRAYHRDMFDAALSFIECLWTRYVVGDLPAALALTGTISRIIPSCRFGEWCQPPDDAGPAAVWMRGEELRRLVAGMLAGGVLFAELRNSAPGGEVVVPAMNEARMAGIELPWKDAAFQALPAAIEAVPGDGTVPVSYLPWLSAGGEPRPRVRFGDAGLWPDLPRRSEARERGLRAGFGRVLDLGPAVVLNMVAELMRRHHRLCKWLSERGLEAYDLEEGPGRDPAVLEEARERRRAFIEALDDARAHLPVEVREAYDAGDSIALRILGKARWGNREWPRLVAFMVWLHVLQILVRSPRDYIRAIARPDERWLFGPEFVEASAHAITVSQLLAAIIHDPGNSIRIPVFLPVAVLRAGFIHALVLRRMSAGEAGDAQVIKGLVEDTAACLGTLKVGGNYWAHTKAVHKVFEGIVLRNEVPSGEQLEALRMARPVKPS